LTIIIHKHEVSPPFKVFLWAILKHEDGREERLAILKLPSWKMKESFLTNKPEWHRLRLIYLGWRGFFFDWELVYDKTT